LSIISAYDPQRLKHVTTSKKSCETFLKRYGSDVKKDPSGSGYLEDMKKHFRCWISKINEGYFTVLDKFLSSNYDKSVLTTLKNVSPMLEEIKFDTEMM
jgi:hypothetical protein